MARTRSSLIVDSIKGRIGEIIIKQYGKRTVVSRVPDMSGIKPTKKQTAKRSKFKEAVAYAQSIIRDPEKKAAYKKTLRRGKTVYHEAIKEYLKRNPYVG
jgi:hypothetical protein